MILMFQAIRGQNISDEPLGGKVPENVLDSVEIDGLNYSLIKVNGYPDSRYCIMGQNNQSGNNGSNNLSSIIHAYVVGGISGDIVQSVDRGTYLCDLNKVYIDKYYRIIFQ